MSEDTSDDSLFSKTYEGMWYLLGIPGIMLVGTVTVALIFKVVRLSKGTSSENDIEGSAEAKTSQEVEAQNQKEAAQGS